MPRSARAVRLARPSRLACRGLGAVRLSLGARLFSDREPTGDRASCVDVTGLCFALPCGTYAGSSRCSGRGASRAHSSIASGDALAARYRGIRLGAPDIAAGRLCRRFRGSIAATDRMHSATRARGVRHVGLTAGGTAPGTDPTTERGCLHAGHPAVHAATKKLRVSGQRHNQHSCERSTR